MVSSVRRAFARALLVGLLMAGASVPTSAQALRTEAEVVAAVRSANVSLEAARARAAAEAERPAQVRRPFPMAEAMLMPQMLAEGEPGVGLATRQTFPPPGRLRADREARAAMAAAAGFEAEALEREQVRSAREAYAELWGLQERAAQLDAFRERLGLYREAALTQVRTGRGPQQAVLNLQVEAERLAERLDALAEEAAGLRARLALLTGGALRLSPADRLAPPEVTAAPAEAPDDHPLLRAGAALVEAETAMARMSRSMLRPELTLGATVNLSPTARRGMYGQELLTPTVGVTVPLWREGVRAEVREAEARARWRALETEHARLALEAEHEEVTARRARLRARIARLETELRPLARQALDTAVAGYPTGAVRLLELLDAQRMALDVELDRIEALVADAALEARLDALLGR